MYDLLEELVRFTIESPGCPLNDGLRGGGLFIFIVNTKIFKHFALFPFINRPLDKHLNS